MKRTKVIIAIALLAVVLASMLVPGCTKKKETKKGTKEESVPNVPQVKQGPDTVVPQGTSLEEYVTEYYEAYLAKEWEKAYDLLPAENKVKEDLDSFVKMRTNMPLEKYTVGDAKITGSAASVTVELSLVGSGEGDKWSTQWLFSKKGKEWVVDSSKSMVQ